MVFGVGKRTAKASDVARRVGRGMGVVLLVLGITGCNPPATAQQPALATPTPLPPAPVLERPTYVVQRGSIERRIELTGRVIPVDLVHLSFRRGGRVGAVQVTRGDIVQQGDILAQLVQDEQLRELAEAEDALLQAQRDLEAAQAQKEKKVQRAKNALEQAYQGLEDAKKQQQKDLERAQQDLADAQRALDRLLPGGDQDLLYAAQKKLDEARRKAREIEHQYSLAKTQAEHAVLAAADNVREVQRAYSDAYWEYEWVKKYGTDPTAQETVDSGTGETRKYHRTLNDKERDEYRRKFEKAEAALAEAQRTLDLRRRDLELAREEEIYQNQQASITVAEAQRDLERIMAGEDDQLIRQQRVLREKQQALEEIQQRTFTDAQKAIDDALLALEEAQGETFHTQIKQVEMAQRSVEKARRAVQNGQIIAPQHGEIIAVKIREGDSVEEFDPVIELANPANLEVAAELSGEQLKQLAEGQPAEITLLSRPDITMPAVIRRLPAPYGAGGSGMVEERDKSTRFQILDTKGQHLVPGAVVKIGMVLERKEDTLVLPPEALRSFEGRKFVVVREGERERRVAVRTGIESRDAVEILEGLKEGDMIVGP